MEESVHCALSGQGAVEFARQIGFPVLNDPRELIVDDISLNITHSDFEDFVQLHYHGRGVEERNDTVSAVAMDTNGHLACAASTGKEIFHLRYSFHNLFRASRMLCFALAWIF